MKSFPYSARTFSAALLALAAAALLPFSASAPAQSDAKPAAPARDRVFAPAPGFDREAFSVVRLLEQFHYNRAAVKPADYADVIPNFMTSFDGQHMFFLETDKVAFTTRYNPRWVYNNLTSLGKTEPAYDIFSTYTKRVTDRINWALAQLDTDIDLNGNDGYLYDRKDEPWPADEAAADALWMQRLKNELINEILSKKTLEEARKDIRKRYQRWLKNLADIEPKDISETYLSTVARLYDPHSSYMSAETLDEFTIGIKAQLIGIGAVLSVEDDYCTIQEIVVGGPADLSKQLQPKDKIIAVAEDRKEPVDVIGMKLRNVVQLIRGKKNTKVRLTVIPASDPSQRKEIVITRDVVNIEASRARGAIYDVPANDGTGATHPIGVISLPGFYDAGTNDKGEPSPSATQDIARLISQFQQSERGIKALVLDMRGNSGGLLSEAINLTNLFVKAGPVVQLKNSYGQVQVDSGHTPEPLYTGPLAVLVSRFSASSAEIVAGALQNYGRAIIIGDSSTHGKGSVQQLLEMRQIAPELARLNPKTGAIKLTTQKYYLPSGDSTQLKGVVSDIALPSIDELLPVGEKSLPHALAWDEIAPSKYEGRPLSADLLSVLREASEKRQATLEEFAHLRKSIDHFKTRYEQKILSLNLDERLAQKAADKAFKKEQDKERNLLAKSDGYNSKEFLLSPPREKNRKAPKSGKNTKPKTEDDQNPESRDPEGRKTEEQQPETPGEASNDTGGRLPSGIRLAGADEHPVAALAETKTNDEAGAPKAPDEDDDEDGLSDEQLEEDAKKLDIHLRETMRVLADAINMAERPVAAIIPAPLSAAAVSRHELPAILRRN